jgi:hypothetical protein
MKQIRNGVFETNSSSTHSIAIPRSFDGMIGRVCFQIGEFGWGWNEVDPADYFYTAIYETSENLAEVNEKISKLKEILDSHDIEYDFEEVECKEQNGWMSFDGYIDHGYELKDFVDELLDDEYKLLRFLSGGLVFTGNDNSNTEERCFINRDEEFLDYYDWHSKQAFKIQNPYYMSDHEDYDWYWKGN